jgi:hypothetical protein
MLLLYLRRPSWGSRDKYIVILYNFFKTLKFKTFGNQIHEFGSGSAMALNGSNLDPH